MLKRLFFGLVCLMAGVMLATAVLVNPLGWAWISPLQNKVQGLMFGAEHAHEAGQAGQLWTCGMHPQVIQNEPGTCPICGMDLTPLKEPASTAAAAKPKEKKIKHYVAPMDPTYISDKPGKSPMGMDLIPVYEEEPEEDTTGVVHIDPVFVQNIGVQSVPVQVKDIPFRIRTIGTVVYNDQQVSLINVKYSGWIENAQVNYIGEPVQKGQKLFDIYSPELVTTQKEYLNALNYAERLNQGDYPEIRDRAQSLLNASRERLRSWDFREEQVRELEETGTPRRAITVYSPVSGVVVGKMDQALEGMYVRPGMNLYKVADLSTVWVEADVFEHQLPWLKVGQTAGLEFSALPGRTYRGTIRYLYPFMNQKTRTLKVSIELPNPGQRLRSEMYANVDFEVPSVKGATTVPEDAVIHSGQRNVVVLDLGEGRFRVKEVELGVNGDQVWEVLSGIEEGDRVVISSQFLIDSESNLREAIQKMMAHRREEASPNPEPDPAETNQ